MNMGCESSSQLMEDFFFSFGERREMHHAPWRPYVMCGAPVGLAVGLGQCTRWTRIRSCSLEPPHAGVARPHPVRRHRPGAVILACGEGRNMTSLAVCRAHFSSFSSFRLSVIRGLVQSGVAVCLVRSGLDRPWFFRGTVAGRPGGVGHSLPRGCSNSRSSEHSV